MSKSGGKFDMSFLARQLQDARVATGFNAYEYEEIAEILLSAFPWKSEVPEGERSELINEAINGAAKGGTITATTLSDALSKAQNIFLAKHRKRFVLITTAFIDPRGFRKRRSYSGVGLMARLPRSFESARASTDSGLPKNQHLPERFVWARVPVSARSVHEAGQRALQQLDFVRGCWNYYANRKVHRLISFPKSTVPINRILRGSYHTLHFPDGRLALDGHWFDVPSPTPQTAGLQSGEWPGMQAMLSSVTRLLRTHPYSDDLRLGIIRYCRALDSMDGGANVLKLWSLAEWLTYSGGANYDTTIRRIQFLFSERELTRNVLEHIRFQRNESIHGGVDLQDPHGLLYQAKGYVEHLLDFHAGMGKQLRSMQRAAEFLDLPADPEILRDRIRLLRKAVKFLR